MVTLQGTTSTLAVQGWWPETGRTTHALIDLDAIEANVRAIRRAVSATGVIAVVKANAYGHGATMVAEAAVDAGATMLAVSTVDEGCELRDAGITAPILVLAPAGPAEYDEAIRAGLTLSVAAPDQVVLAARAARSTGRRGDVQIKVETGMNRYGCDPSAAIALGSSITADPALRLTGVFTHFADADGADLSFTDEQTSRFGSVIASLREAGIDPGLVHHSNTAGSVRLSTPVQSAVRLGIGLYGLRPDEAVPLLPGMRQALLLRTRVAQVRRLTPGDTVSYGRTYRAKHHETVALLPIGYADGLRRALSGTGWVGIGDRTAPIRGRVCMDQVVVGCDEATVRVGEGVVVFGDGVGAAPTLTQVARLAGTINYEIVTGIAHRVPRWYVRGGEPVAVLRGGRLRRL